MVTTLYLIRHGETEGSGQMRYKGSIDVPMSEKGFEQIHQASLFIQSKLKESASAGHSSYLKDIRTSSKKVSSGDFIDKNVTLKAVYTSNLSRAVKSGEIIAKQHGLDPIIIEAWAADPLRYSPPEGESTLEVRDRVIKVLDGILNRHQDEHIAVVAHGGVNRIILCHLLGIPLENIFRIEQDYGCLNIIEFWEKYPVVKLINGTKNKSAFGSK
jgi:alpha-ribazole phosphatase